MMRFISLTSLAAAAVAAALVVVPAPSAASASRVATPAPFHATINAPLAGLFLGCCHHLLGLEPTAMAIPRVGRAVVSGQISFCGNRGPCIPEGRGTTLFLVFSTPSGDTLTLGGFTPIGSTSLTWTVVGGTGRFADASGSGVYTYDWEFTEDDLVATIALTGTLRLRG